MEQVRWRSVYKSTSISWGVIKSLMKEVDWSSDLLLSCCCLLLPVMSSNGIQLTTEEGKYGHGRGGWGCNGAVCVCLCVCTLVLTEYWSSFVRAGVFLWGYDWTICSPSDPHSCCVKKTTMKKSNKGVFQPQELYPSTTYIWIVGTKVLI